MMRHLRHPAFRDMMGVRVGSPGAEVEVVRRAQNQYNGNTAWFVRCPNGHEFVVQGIYLRACQKRGGSVGCRECDPKLGGRRRERAAVEFATPTAPRAFSACTLCGASTHTRMHCPMRAARKGLICSECAGLPHRRPPEGCWKCHGPYVPERRPTIEDALAQPNHNRREIL